jgi:hypothetical protein
VPGNRCGQLRSAGPARPVPGRDLPWPSIPTREDPADRLASGYRHASTPGRGWCACRAGDEAVHAAVTAATARIPARRLRFLLGFICPPCEGLVTRGRPVIQPGLPAWPDVHSDVHPRMPQFQRDRPSFSQADCRALPSLQLAVAAYRRVQLAACRRSAKSPRAAAQMCTKVAQLRLEPRSMGMVCR